MILPAGTPNVRAARWIHRSKIELLVLPFHLHRGDGGEVLDGIGVLQELPADFNPARLTIFMPVRAFSWGASFQRRLDQLKAENPVLAGSILIAHQDELGTATLSAKLRRAAETARKGSRRRPNTLSGLSAGLPSSWPSGEPSSRRPGLLSTGDSGEFSLRPSARPSEPPVSSRSWLRGGGGAEDDPDSLVLPKLPADLTESESARDSFRRAAEIGLRARREAGLDSSPPKKKTQEG